MPATRYPQFCALARAAELIGERWTLLVVRELLLGPKRFTDLRERLPDVSSSVLTERLARLEEDGLVRRETLEPPAASTVYELTDHGRALEPVVFELIRWGARFLFPPRPAEHFDPEGLRLVLAAYARKTRAPAGSMNVRVRAEDREAVIHIAGGAKGTSVRRGPASADVTITTDGITVLGLMSGRVEPSEAMRDGRVQAEGDQEVLSSFPDFFQLGGDPKPRLVRNKWTATRRKT